MTKCSVKPVCQVDPALVGRPGEGEHDVEAGGFVRGQLPVLTFYFLLYFVGNHALGLIIYFILGVERAASAASMDWK